MTTMELNAMRGELAREILNIESREMLQKLMRYFGKEWWACVDLTGGCQLAFQGGFQVPQHAPRWVCSDCLI